LIQAEQIIQQEISEIQNLEAVKKTAETKMNMRPLDISCIRKLSA
jgi:hypothetical protein